jgi:YfiH family protein
MTEGSALRSVGDLSWLEPVWPVAERVRVVSTLRRGGVSEAPYASLNLAAHVGDDASAVNENRRRLAAAVGLPGEPYWLDQVHGSAVVEARPQPSTRPAADASFACVAGAVCAVATADCLPVVIADERGARVGIAHAGWRGLAGGVIEATVESIGGPRERLVAWLGPAISAPAFEVGAEVRAAFLARDPGNSAAFTAHARKRFQADLYALARMTLRRLGVERVDGGGFCTHTDEANFFSFRRDGRTGRMLTLAWLA